MEMYAQRSELRSDVLYSDNHWINIAYTLPVTWKEAACLPLNFKSCTCIDVKEYIFWTTHAKWQTSCTPRTHLPRSHLEVCSLPKCTMLHNVSSLPYFIMFILTICMILRKLVNLWLQLIVCASEKSEGKWESRVIHSFFCCYDDRMLLTIQTLGSNRVS